MVRWENLIDHQDTWKKNHAYFRLSRFAQFFETKFRIKPVIYLDQNDARGMS